MFRSAIKDCNCTLFVAAPNESHKHLFYNFSGEFKNPIIQGYVDIFGNFFNRREAGFEFSRKKF